LLKNSNKPKILRSQSKSQKRRDLKVDISNNNVIDGSMNNPNHRGRGHDINQL